jgi:hypothetical protein
MVAREGLDVMRLCHISSCVLVREEGVNGLLGIVYGDSGRWMDDLLLGSILKRETRGALYVRVILGFASCRCRW